MNYKHGTSLILLIIILTQLTGCPFGLSKKRDSGFGEYVRPSASLAGRSNVITMDNRGSANVSWFADGILFAQRYEAASGWGEIEIIRPEFDGTLEHLNAASSFNHATIVWEETPALSSGNERVSFAAVFVNNAWSTAPISISNSAPGTDPNVGANIFSTDEYLASIVWNELGSGTNEITGSNFETLVPLYREQQGDSTSLSSPVLVQDVPEQAWISDNLNVALDGSSNTFVVWTRRAMLPDNTVVDGIFTSRKTPDGSPSDPRLIGIGENISNVRLTVDQAGNAHAFWIDDGRLRSNYFSTSNGFWRDADEAIDVGQQTDVVDYDVDVNASGRIALVWFTESLSTVYTALQFPGDFPQFITPFESENVNSVKTGIDDQHNMRISVQSSSRLFTAFYQENIVDWTPLEFVTDISSGNLSFDMDGSGTAVALWDLESGTDIGRYVWVPGAPEVNFTAVPNPAEVDQIITFDASNSSADFGIAGYQWDFDNDGNFDLTDGPVVNHSFSSAGEMNTRLRVTDNRGLFSETSQTIIVNNPDPTQHLLIISSNVARGVVTSSPTGINCGSDCDELFNEGTTVTLTATPHTGYVTNAWNGDCVATTANQNMATVLVNDDLDCEVEFVASQGEVNLYLTLNGNTGRVFDSATGFECENSGPSTISECVGNFSSGTTLTLEVETNVPVEWLYGCDTVIPVTEEIFHCEINMNGNREAAVYFEVTT